jgi:alanine racemase
MMTDPPARLLLDGDALVSNWRWLARTSGKARCGAAIKADGYGLGAPEVLHRLAAAGCRDFYVATWGEALALGRMPAGTTLSVFHGVRDGEIAHARAGLARPVLNSVTQVARWKAAGGGACDIMIDTGMNRLGLSVEDATSGLLDGLMIETLMSHLACADEPGHPLNRRQLDAFASLRLAIPAQAYSLANSAGICLGADYAFDLTRPGLAIYGGIQNPAMDGHIRQVARPEAEILQVRTVAAGESIGYNATFTANRPMRTGILNLGYADGYLRGFSDRGRALAGDRALPVIGRVSMDLTAIDLSAAPELGEGDKVIVDLDPRGASRQSGLSQYELLTGLGRRYQRVWS